MLSETNRGIVSQGPLITGKAQVGKLKAWLYFEKQRTPSEPKAPKAVVCTFKEEPNSGRHSAEVKKCAQSHVWRGALRRFARLIVVAQPTS